MASNHRRVRRLSATVRSISMDMHQNHHHHHNSHNSLSSHQPENRFKIDLSRIANKSAGPEPKCWRAFTDNWPEHSQTIGLGLVFLLIWGIIYSTLPEVAHPTAPLMKFLFLFVGAQFCAIIVSQFGVPDMLGMIFWGLLYRNVGFAEFGELARLESFLRELSLVNIMLLAGLGVDVTAMKECLCSILKLTFIPMVGEVAVVSVLSHYLVALPWIWALLLGFIITAISPNVVVTVVLSLREQKLGSNVIHTIILAVTTFNNVVAIFTSSVLLGVIFSTGQLRTQILQGPVSIGIGIIFGGVFGFFLGHIPSNYSPFKNAIRFMLTICGGLFVVCGSKAIGFNAAGALGCVVLAVVANLRWKSSDHQVSENKVDAYLNTLWKFVKPISFALIGKEVNFAVLEGVALYGIVVIIAAALVRLAFAYISMLGKDGLNWKERVYVSISSLPKATVQAAIGPLALEMVAKYDAEEHFELANCILIVSVLAIILTAPLGALLMVKLSPRLLKKEPDLDDEQL